MKSLVWIAIAAGTAHGLVGSAAALAPALLRRGLDRFPRHRVLGPLLAALGVAWAAWNVYHGDLGRFSVVKPWIVLIAPAIWVGMVYYMNELLSVRALGGLLLLAANPVLKAARLSEDPWSLWVSVMAYVWVGIGMMWVLGPWRLRRGLARVAPTDSRLRGVGIGHLLAASVWLILAGRWM
jgi:hypothetical protein